MSELVIDPEREQWFADPVHGAARAKAVQFTADGNSKAAIAVTLKVHVNTIRNWSKNEHFMHAVQELMQEKFSAVPLRRANQLTNLTDKAYKITNELLTKAEKEPENPNIRRAAMGWGNDFRAYAEKEREALGLSVQKQQGNGSGVNIFVGGPQQAPAVSASGGSFKGFLSEGLKRLPQATVPEMLSTSVQDTIAEATRQVLIEQEDILEILFEEDLAEEQSNK